VFAGGDFDLEEIVARAAADDLSGLVGDDVLDVLILARLDRFTDVFEFFVFEHDNLPIAAEYSANLLFLRLFLLCALLYHLPPDRPAGAPAGFSEDENTP
jgi:hypothetical protein